MFRQGFAKVREKSNSHGNLLGAWSGRGEVVLKKQRVKEAQNENWNHELTWQALLYKHQGTTGMPRMVLHIANVCRVRFGQRLGHIMNAELQSWSCSGGQPVQDSFPIKRGKKFKGFPVHFCTSDQESIRQYLMQIKQMLGCFSGRNLYA